MNKRWLALLNLFLVACMLAGPWLVLVSVRTADAQTYYWRNWYNIVVDALDPYYLVDGQPCYDLSSSGGSYTVTRINADDRCNGLVYNRWFSAYDEPTVSAAYANANELIWMFDYVRTNNNTNNSHDRLWEQQTITGFGNRLNFIGGLADSGTCENSVYWPEATGAITVMGCSIGLDYQDSITLSNFRIRSNNPFGDVTPTPTLPPPSTPFPVENACIDGALLASQPTATPRVYITPTPFGTRPPATSTPAGTPTITPTPQPQGLNVLTRFDTSLAPLTMNGVSPLVTWQSANGPNGSPGIAYLPFDDAPTVNQPGQLSPPNITPQGPQLVYERPGMPRQIRIVADVQVPDLPSGTYAYIQVFYWADGGLGTAPWALAQNIRVNSTWHTVSALFTVPSNVALPRAIALRAVIGIAPIDNPLGFQPQAIGNGVQMDNVRIVAGADANNPTSTGLPVCAGTGGGTGTTPPISTRICLIGRIDIDVFDCPLPSSFSPIGNLVDWLGEIVRYVGDWINWLNCNVTTFFSFSKENLDQLKSILERNAHHQPFAASNDIFEGIFTLSSIIDFLQTMPAQNPNTGSPDFDATLTDDALDRFPVLTTPTGDGGFTAAQASCPAILTDISRVMAPGMCWATFQFRDSFATRFVQWLFDIACWIWLTRSLLSLLNGKVNI